MKILKATEDQNDDPEVDKENEYTRTVAKETFDKLVDYVLKTYPIGEIKSAAQLTGIIIGIGACFEGFLATAKERGILGEDVERVLRANAKVIGTPPKNKTNMPEAEA